jgi:hypothetical protein
MKTDNLQFDPETLRYTKVIRFTPLSDEEITAEATHAALLYCLNQMDEARQVRFMSLIWAPTKDFLKFRAKGKY